MIDYPEAEEPTALKNQAVSGSAQTELRKIFFSEVQALCVIHGCPSQLLPVCSNALEMLFLIGMPSLAEKQGVCCSFHSRACSCYCLEKCLQFKVDSLLHAWPPAAHQSCQWGLSQLTILQILTGRKSDHPSCSTGSMNHSQQQSIDQNRLLILHNVLNLVCASKFLSMQDLPSRGAHLSPLTAEQFSKTSFDLTFRQLKFSKINFTLNDCWVIPVKTFPPYFLEFFPSEDIYQTEIRHYSSALCWWTIKSIAFLQQFSHCLPTSSFPASSYKFQRWISQGLSR